MKRLPSIALLYCLFFIFYCNAQQNHDITIIKNSAYKLINENSKIEVLASSFIASEGPLWDSKNNQLIFSDVRQNKIFTWSERSGINEYITPSGSTGHAPFASDVIKGSNGLAFDKNKNIVYQGAIDDAGGSKFWTTDLNESTNFVRTVISDIESKRPVSISKTRPYGCSVKYG